MILSLTFTFIQYISMNRTVYEENQMRERILSFINHEDISQRKFALAIGRQPTNVYQILSGERHFPRGFCADVLNAYPKINKDWLAFGEGDMFAESTETKLVQSNTRPRLPQSLSGGHLPDYYNGDKRKLCKEKPVVGQFSDYDFTLILKNNRMSPKYDRGDELFFKKSTIIEWGNDYLLDTPEGPKFKKIYDEMDCVRCVSYNKEEYPEFFVPKNMIMGYYRLVGVLRIL